MRSGNRITDAKWLVLQIEKLSEVRDALEDFDKLLPQVKLISKAEDGLYDYACALLVEKTPEEIR